MNVTASVVFCFAQGLLMWWLLFGSKTYMETVILASGDLTESKTGSWKTQKTFRVTVLICCTLLAGISVFIASEKTLSVFETIKLGMAVLCTSAVMLTDFYIYIIPNSFLIGAAIARAILLLIEMFFRPDWMASLMNSVIGFGVAFVVMFLFSVMTRQGIGMGDVKLMAVLGMLCGLTAVINVLIYALMLCVVCSAVLVVRKKKSIKDKVPFGPFLYGGLIIALCTQAF